MGLPKRLTEMQMRFAENLVFGGPDGPVTKTEAAIIAGYSKDHARQEGSTLTNPKLYPLVVKYIGCLLYTSPSPRDGLLSRMPSSA